MAADHLAKRRAATHVHYKQEVRSREMRMQGSLINTVSVLADALYCTMEIHGVAVEVSKNSNYIYASTSLNATVANTSSSCVSGTTRVDLRVYRTGISVKYRCKFIETGITCFR